MNPFDYSFFFNKKLISGSPASPVSLATDYIFNSLNRTARNTYNSKLALNNVLSNLITAYVNGRYLIISKSSNEYSNYTWYGLNHYTYRLIIGWIETLFEQGFIHQVKGYYDSIEETGKRTRLWIGEKLISTIDEHNTKSENLIFLCFKRPIILKDKNKTLVKYNLSTRLLDKIKFLNEYNEFIESCQILFPVNAPYFFEESLPASYPLFSDFNITIYHSLLTQVVINTSSGIPIMEGGIPLLITLEPKALFNKKLRGQLHRVFNNQSWSQGGRFYSGGSFQQLSEKDRAKLTINTLPVTELDYSAYHLNMIYNLTGNQFDDDPYTSVNNNPKVRPILKLVCLIAINSKNKSQALRALREEIRKNPELEKLKRLYELDEKELLRKFESVHFRISNYFFSNCGIRLQFLDSEVAETILKYFTSRDIPCLPVHDSFLVPIKYKDELECVMREVYKSKFKYDIKIK
jgi:hypothetical protein